MTKTLLIDGNNLLKIGVKGVKDFFHKGKHVGGTWHFINTLRRFIDEQNFDKVVVMWDGNDSSLARKLIYPQYKSNRNLDINQEQENSFTEQKDRVKQYLEEAFIQSHLFPRR